VPTFSRFLRKKGMKNERVFMKDKEKEVEANGKRCE